MDEILEFWFGDPPVPYSERRRVWFGKNAQFDQQIRDRFLTIYHQAAQDELTDWQKSPLGCLALILLCDQVPRNVFRGQPQAFATDPKALALSKWAIDQGVDQQLDPVQRVFVYLPLEHSENLTDQQQSVQQFRQLCRLYPEFNDCLDYALRHLQVIEQFGRFPHRNAILGRDTTPAEAEFLKQPGSSF